VSAFLDTDRLLGFFRDSGFQVYRSANAAWYEAGPRFLLGVPTHDAVVISRAEGREAMRATGALGIRYITADNATGRESWQMMVTGADYDLAMFSGNTRSKVRRGLKNNEIRRISGAELKEAGEQAFLDTVSRQGRSDRYGVDRWHKLLDAADATEGIEIWSAWHEGTLAAYMLIMLFEDSCEFYEARSRNDTLRYYPNNALLYTLTCDILVERKIPQITFGIEGLEELDSLDAFKLAMGYERRPVRQHVMFHPVIEAGLSIPPLRGILGLLATRTNGSSFVRRVHALTSFRNGGVAPDRDESR
jgi:hypothetical protein